MFKTKKTLQMLNFTHCSKTPFTIFYVKNKKMEGEFKHEVRQFQKPYDNQQAEQISLMV